MTAPVGSFAPNPFGLYDMMGNVWEWTYSEYFDPYNGKEQSCANNVNDNSPVVIRGGSWDSSPVYIRAATRGWFRVSWCKSNLGFRLVRT